MSERGTDSVYGGRTGMDTRLSLTQDILYMDTESSLRRHAFPMGINIFNGQPKSTSEIRNFFQGPSTLKKFQLKTQREQKSN